MRPFTRTVAVAVALVGSSAGTAHATPGTDVTAVTLATAQIPAGLLFSR